MTTSVAWTSGYWSTEEFRGELRGFVVASLGPHVTLEPLKVRPWSTVWKVTGRDGTYYVKQNCPGQAHEARLAGQLAQIAPAYVVPVVAADPARDLLLTADLGPTLRRQRPDDVDLWCRIVADAARLQRRVAPHADRLLLSRMPAGDAMTYVGDAAGRLAALPATDPRRLPPATASRLSALLPSVGAWADQVAELDLPLTLQHNDLHDNNVVAPDGTGPLRFFDFADALLAEPLGNLLVPLTTLADVLGAGPGDQRLVRVADAALEVWSDLVPASRLRAALPAALQLARLARVESWRRIVCSMTPEERGVWGSAPADWLATLADDPPVGSLPRM